jgi:hypothetical protein
MDNGNEKHEIKRRKAQCVNEPNKRMKIHIDASGGTAERLARQAEYQRKYRARKKEERLRQVRQNNNTNNNSRFFNMAAAAYVTFKMAAVAYVAFHVSNVSDVDTSLSPFNAIC